LHSQPILIGGGGGVEIPILFHILIFLNAGVQYNSHPLSLDIQLLIVKKYEEVLML
jgi:hypothetical protein